MAYILSSDVEYRNIYLCYGFKVEHKVLRKFERNSVVGQKIVYQYFTT